MTFAVSDLHRSYGSRPVLRGVNFSLEKGEVVCLMGENGAGKTTFIDTVLSRVGPDRGEVLFHGVPLNSVEERVAFIARTAVLGHDAGVFADLSAEENLRFFARAYRGRLEDDDRHRIDELLDAAGLRQRRRDLVRTYSRGMRQKLGVCRAILHSPEVLFLDEPLTALDASGVDFFFRMLESVRGQSCALVVTHDAGPFEGIADGFVYLSGGVFSDRSRAPVRTRQKR